MKINSIFCFFLFSFFTCSNSQKSEIEAFEYNFGNKNSKLLTKIVDNFEKDLLLLYPNTSINDAYLNYLKGLNLDNTAIVLDPIIKKEIKESNISNEFYLIENNFIQGINYRGKFFVGLKNIKNKDFFIESYLTNIESAGMISYQNFIDGVLSSEPDFNNYFHKRIIISYLFM